MSTNEFKYLRVKQDGTEKSKQPVIYKLVTPANGSEPAVISPLGWRTSDEVGAFYCEMNDCEQVVILNTHPELKSKSTTPTTEVYVRDKGLVRRHKNLLPKGSIFNL